MRKKILMIFLSMVMLLLISCNVKTSQEPEDVATSAYSLSDFMPDAQMVKYFYGDIESGGSFQWVLPIDDMSYEVYYVTTMDSTHEIYERIGDEIVRTYLKGGEGGYKQGAELYEKHIVLKGPLQVGQTWENKSYRGEPVTYTITGVDVKKTYHGNDYDCIEVTTSDDAQLYYVSKLGFVELNISGYPMKLAEYEWIPQLPETDDLDKKLNYLDIMRPSIVYNEQWLMKKMSPKRQMVKLYAGDFENSGAVRIITHRSKDGYEEIYGNSGLFQRRRYTFTSDGLVMDYIENIEDMTGVIPLTSDEEANHNELLIKMPIKLGQKWETMDTYRSISQVPTAYNLQGDPTNYLEITIETKEGYQYKEYYDQDLGYVKSVHSDDLYHTEILTYHDETFSEDITVQMIFDYLN